MKKKLRTGLSMIALFALISQSNAQENNQEIMQNPLLKEWQGPYEGVPAFDKMEVSLVKPAIRKGMELHLEEINKIANNTAEATFENTIIPMEKAGKELDRAFTYYGIYSRVFLEDQPE
jgi:peptidyl-dipeptidase Dcp